MALKLLFFAGALTWNLSREALKYARLCEQTCLDHEEDHTGLRSVSELVNLPKTSFHRKLIVPVAEKSPVIRCPGSRKQTDKACVSPTSWHQSRLRLLSYYLFKEEKSLHDIQQRANQNFGSGWSNSPGWKHLNKRRHHQQAAADKFRLSWKDVKKI
ncbi:hypothetical protein SELMODRAFT_420953 [Selaginella moellendorffii]|uniref:Uncharacterized protein n=1 Tax=Selaginella moellendorffii TaxID=88036 RepID=D8SDN4_SELML|nr:hypothetical protein SELMODRAFT_420953 [Selaginella moellendorffii]